MERVIDKNHARYFIRALSGVEARNQSTKGMPNEHIRPLDPSVFQCGVYLANPEGAGVFRTGFAPPIPEWSYEHT